jgi:hypothetical protein
MVVTNVAGLARSASAILTVLAPPTASTLGASNVTAASAVLNATINPQGAATACYFQYGVTTNYGYSSATNLLTPGSSAVAVGTPIAGLTPATLFHYRIVATNAAGTTFGQDATFTTSVAPPLVSTLGASDVAADSALLNAVVNPLGAATACFFQYGVTTNYGYLSATQQLAAGVTGVILEMPVAGLAPGTLYHCRVVATNAAGTSTGQDVTFTTSVAPPSAVTLGASNVTSASALLNAAVDPRGTAGSCYFEYGLTTSYGSASPVVVLPAGNGATAMTVAAPVAGLAPGTLYHYRVVAANAGGTATGEDATFTTFSLPSIQVSGALTSSGGNMELSLAALPGATFTVLSSPNMALPLSDWTVLGQMTEVQPGRYRFTDPRPARDPQCYYRIRYP